MEHFHKFLDSLHTSDNSDLLHTIVEGLWSIYGNNPYAADMGGELLTEETETNPKDKTFEEISEEKKMAEDAHRIAEMKKAREEVKIGLFAKF
jgi:hypothetical protein